MLRRLENQGWMQFADISGLAAAWFSIDCLFSARAGWPGGTSVTAERQTLYADAGAVAAWGS